MTKPDAPFKITNNASSAERNVRQELVRLMDGRPIPDSEILANLGLFLTRQNLSEIFFLREMYEHIVDVHGVVMELGVRWGRNLALYESLRGIYEPFNHNRRIIGFDTFQGFPSVDAKDGSGEVIEVGAYKVSENYEDYLAQVLDIHEQQSPIAHIKKYELVKGDATVTVKRYLEEHPETIIALAYFDFDIYEPTKACLEAIRPHLTRGSVVGFDEINNRTFPGETRALQEVLGIGTYRIRHSRYSPTQAYLIID